MFRFFGDRSFAYLGYVYSKGDTRSMQGLAVGETVSSLGWRVGRLISGIVVVLRLVVIIT